jgi:hypothetical protein
LTGLLATCQTNLCLIVSTTLCENLASGLLPFFFKFFGLHIDPARSAGA